MSNQSTGQLPSYIANAAPNPAANRAPWYKNTAPTYAGIFLWFVFWQDAVNSSSLDGGLSAGLGVALLGLLVSALICHFLFYLVPGLLGQKTGLPLYIVGTSTFGANGGFIMPGFLMGLLQFGWLSVNIYFSSLLLSSVIPLPASVLMIIWGILAAFVGLKGIQYVAKIATYLPLIPLVILLLMFVKTMGGIGSFNPKALEETHQLICTGTVETASPGGLMTPLCVIAFIITYVVGFFATAGAAGVDFGTGSRNASDVKMGGLVGVALAIFVTAGLGTAIIAGAYGNKDMAAQIQKAGKAQVVAAVEKAGADAKKAGKTLKDEEREAVAISASHDPLYRTTSLMGVILGEKFATWAMFLLAIAAFPPACFSSLIAANSFKTTLPNVNPFISVGIGAVISIVLAVTGIAAQVIPVFVVIGASFGPICGAMMVDYLLSGKQWSGPRAGFNPAGWIAWLLGFAVGIAPNFGLAVPQVPAPLVAFIVGAVVYFICAKLGMLSRVIPMPVKK